MSNKKFQVQDFLFFPISLLYGMIIWFRNRLFDFKILKSTEYSLPIISVGNITVGGTGKTPHVEYLINLLNDEFKIAVLSRGYKRKTSGFFLGMETSTASDIGDEPLQIKQKFANVIVAVDGNRNRGIQKLLKISHDLNAVILDDAFQHRYVLPGLSILIVDYNNLIKTDFLLPYGRLREPASERVRADIIIISKCPVDIKPIDQRLLEMELKMFAYQKVHYTTIKYGEPIPVFKKVAKETSIQTLKKLNPVIFMLTGIANPKPLKDYLNSISENIIELNYPDHYNFTAKDMHGLIEKFSADTGKNKYIITTEKDAMRLQQFTDLEEEIKAAMYYIPVYVQFLENDEKAFNHYITTYVRNNKPDSFLHQPKIKKQA
jgi:tetraacyldisaccharide 4'-kinase